MRVSQIELLLGQIGVRPKHPFRPEPFTQLRTETGIERLKCPEDLRGVAALSLLDTYESEIEKRRREAGVGGCRSSVIPDGLCGTDVMRGPKIDVPLNGRPPF